MSCLLLPPDYSSASLPESTVSSGFGASQSGDPERGDPSAKDVKLYSGNTVMIFQRYLGTWLAAIRNKKITIVWLCRKTQALLQTMDRTRLGSRVEITLWRGRPHLPCESQTLFLQKDHWQCWAHSPYGMCLCRRELSSVETEVLAVIEKIYKKMCYGMANISTFSFTHEIKHVYCAIKELKKNDAHKSSNATEIYYFLPFSE